MSTFITAATFKAPASLRDLLVVLPANRILRGQITIACVGGGNPSKRKGPYLRERMRRSEVGRTPRLTLEVRVRLRRDPK